MKQHRWAALLLLSAVSSTALGVTLTVVPREAAVTAGSQSSFDVRIEGLGAQEAPSLGAFEVGVRYDPAVLTVDPINVTFSHQLSPSVQNASTANGTLTLVEVSLTSPEGLDTTQDGSFNLANVSYTANQVGTSPLDLSGVTLGDALGLPLDATLQGASVDVIAPISPPSPTSPLLTVEGAEVGTALVDACSSLAGLPRDQLTAGQSGLLETCGNLVMLPPDEQAALLDQAVPRIDKPAAQFGLVTTRNQFQNVQTRLTDLRGGVGGAAVAGASLELDGQRIDGTQLAALLGPLTGGGASADGGELGGRLGFFINGNLGYGNRDTTELEEGFDSDVYNITAGVDYRLSDAMILGAAVGYSNTNADFDTSSNNTEVDAWNGMLYGTYYPTEALYVDGILSAGTSSYDVRRRDPFSGLTATGKTDGTSFGAALGAGYDFQRAQWSFGPYGRLNYVKVKVDGYRESPTAGNEYRFQGQDATSTTLTLGGRTTYAIGTRYGVVLPQAWLDWAHEFSNDSQTLTATLVNDPTNTPIELLTDSPDRNYFRAGLGASAQFAKGRSAYLLYEQLFGHSYFSAGTLQAGVRLEF